jgi:F-type H+-transporting ATPase subunit c
MRKKSQKILTEEFDMAGVDMASVDTIAMASIVVAGMTMAIGSIGPAIGEGWALSRALSAIAQQPDEANNITRTLFVGLAMVESIAIYCFVISIILIFANPFWTYVAK